MKLYYARHGEPVIPYHEMSLEELANERYVSLGNKGIFQARQLGESLLGKGIERIVASPFQRTVETAAGVYEVLAQENPDIAFLIDKRLEEIRLGEERNFKNLRKWLATGVAEGAENVWDSRKDIQSLLCSLKENPVNTFCVGHQSKGLVLQLEIDGFEIDTPVLKMRNRINLGFCQLLEWEI